MVPIFFIVSHIALHVTHMLVWSLTRHIADLRRKPLMKLKYCVNLGLGPYLIDLGAPSRMILSGSPVNTLNIFIVTITMRDSKSISYKGNFTTHILYVQVPFLSNSFIITFHFIS